MKHDYTDTQLQAAIDKAFAGSKPILFDADPANSIWGSQKLARLDLIKSALDALPEPEPPTVDWKAKFEALESQWVVAERAVDNVLKILPDLKKYSSWENAATLIREYIDSANARAEKAEVELARVREACDRMSKQEVLSISQLRPLAEAGPVPEGCVRVRAWEDINRWIYGGEEWDGDTHFADIRLPVPAEKPDPYADKPLVTKPISLPTPNEAISLRDWFAGQALAGLLVNQGANFWDGDARNAYAAADAMIKEREVKP